MKLLLKINVLLIIIISNATFAQTTTDNHRKYWWYKSRLNNDFVKVGIGDGESFPFNQRGSTSSGFTSPDVRSNMKIGDGTSTLGLYIAQLATEYALLVKHFQNTDKVKHELFCALNAFDRVDYKAEGATVNGTNTLNGFFVRDDIPKNFVFNNYDHFNYYNTWDGNPSHVLPWTVGPGNDPEPNTAESGDHGFHSNCQTGMFKTESSWSGWAETGAGLFAESQDQAYDLLLGLAFVNKFVGSSVTDGTAAFPYTGETSIREQARKQAKRIIDHIRDAKNIADGSSCNGSLATGWHIKNPVNCNNVSTGDNATTYGYPLAEGESFITSDNYTMPMNNTLGVPTGGSTYHNNYSQTIGFDVWNTLADVPIYNAGNQYLGMDSRAFNVNLAAICNCVYANIPAQFIQQTISTYVHGWFGVIFGWIWKLVTIAINYTIPASIQNITNSAISINAYTDEAPLDHGPIAHALLHDLPAYVPNQNYSFEYLINVAPCDGIYNFGSNQSTYHWSSDNRCDHPNRRGTNPTLLGTNSYPTGEYNGIDFMLYHNLYYLYNNENTMTDLSDIKIYNQNGLPCHDVNAYETIDAQNTTVACFNPTVWRAGKTIRFGSGFQLTGNGSTTSGPNFHAYIQKFDCAADVGVFRMANGADSTGQESNSMADDSYANGVRFHTVNYPEQMAVLNTEPVTEHDQNLITELPAEESPLDAMLKAANPDYSRELFVKPTITKDEVSAYFLLADNETGFITVMDLGGKIVYSNNALKQMDSGVSIDLSSYAAGTYILKFTTTNGTNKTQKIIKE